MAGQRGWTLLLVESVAIFASVLLAFLVEEWRDDRRELNRMRDTAAAIRVELRQDRTEIEAALALHQEIQPRVAAMVQAYDRTGVFPSPQDIPEPVRPDISTVAFEIGVATGALAPLPAETQIALARAYKAIGEIEQNEANLGFRNAQIRYNDGLQYLSGRLYYLTGAIGLEQAALDDIDAALAVLAALDSAPPPAAR